MQASHPVPARAPLPPLRAHRAPDPAPAEDPMPEPFDTPHPHHQPVHLPQDDEPVPDPRPSVSARHQAGSDRSRDDHGRSPESVARHCGEGRSPGVAAR